MTARPVAEPLLDAEARLEGFDNPDALHGAPFVPEGRLTIARHFQRRVLLAGYFQRCLRHRFSDRLLATRWND